MQDIYLYMLIALSILAIADLVVGVSNDAVNFLNSAIGSKAISFRTIMIVASIGIAAGAIFSSGLMEVARKGIFIPSEFVYHEIMIIFMAVMITDILLLDFFNTLGMPTSTTVSIVFELLGAAVCMALVKIATSPDLSFYDIGNYINTQKATQIILGILLSVVIAFSIGAVVQYLTRLLLSFRFAQKPKWAGALFGGIALTSILYFIFIKGIKGTKYAKTVLREYSKPSGENFLDWANRFLHTDYANLDTLIAAKKGFFVFSVPKEVIAITLRGFIDTHVLEILLVGFVLLFVISYIVIRFFRVNIYQLIIIAGTFALALAFAGNDLVNFIGVPIAALAGYTIWTNSGIPAQELLMHSMQSKSETPTIILLIAGLIMVLTLWFSSKAKRVVKTSIDLSRQGGGEEKFSPNFLSRFIVRISVWISDQIQNRLPQSWKTHIDKQFDQRLIPVAPITEIDPPAFDMVRAAVNLMVAGVLISIATAMKLPLSTTYVTFMVAMGTSLADRAWGTEIAVYRVAGVIQVIGGWFFTAFSAFAAAAGIAFLIHLHPPTMLVLLLSMAGILLVRNSMRYRKKSKAERVENELKKSESSSIQGVIEESADTIKSFANRASTVYGDSIDKLAKYDLAELKKNKKRIAKLESEVDELRDSIFYFIKNLDESSVGASNFYIEIVGYLEEITHSLKAIAKASHKHVNNNHKKIRFSQIKDLQEIQEGLQDFYLKVIYVFEERTLEQLSFILEEKKQLFELVNTKINTQVARTRSEESSPKNTTLYFCLLLETKNLISSTMNLLATYRDGA